MYAVAAVQEVELKNLGVWARHGAPPWAADAVVDLPRERLPARGYACLLQEGGLTLTSSAGAAGALPPTAQNLGFGA